MSMPLSGKHLRLLRKIGKEKVIRTSKYEIKDIEYLRSEGLVTATQVDKEDDFFYQPHITEKGKAVLYTQLHTIRRANIAIVLSIIAMHRIVFNSVHSLWRLVKGFHRVSYIKTFKSKPITVITTAALETQSGKSGYLA